MRINNLRVVDQEDIRYVDALIERIGDVGLPLDSVTFWMINDILIGTSLRYKNHHDLRPRPDMRDFFVDSEDQITPCIDTIQLHQLIGYPVGQYVSLIRMNDSWIEVTGLFDHQYMKYYTVTRIAIERNRARKGHQRHATLLSDHIDRDGGLSNTEGIQAPGFRESGDGSRDGSQDGGDH